MEEHIPILKEETMDTVTSGIIPPVSLETPAVDSSMKRSRNAGMEKGATEEIALFFIR